MDKQSMRKRWSHCRYSEDGTKKECSGCGEFLEFNNFCKVSNSNRLRANCNECRKRNGRNWARDNKERLRLRLQQKRYLLDPEKLKAQRRRVREWHYKNTYGITIEEKERMMQCQSGKCAICETSFKDMLPNRIHIDHDHKTGSLRGILCHHCNQVVGQARDSVEVLERAAIYVGNHFKMIRKHPDIFKYMPRTKFTEKLFSDSLH